MASVFVSLYYFFRQFVYFIFESLDTSLIVTNQAFLGSSLAIISQQYWQIPKKLKPDFLKKKKKKNREHVGHLSAWLELGQKYIPLYWPPV